MTGGRAGAGGGVRYALVRLREEEREIAWHMRVVGNLQERGRGAAALGLASPHTPLSRGKTKGARQNPAKKNLFWADKSDGREVAASLP